MNKPASAATMKTLVWDVPTRVFHWLFALSFTIAYLSHESEYYADIHRASGYVFFGLLLFRIIWGFIGTPYARFSSFVFRPDAEVEYLRSLLAEPKHYLGHNPAGALAIFLLLALGLVIGISGVALDWGAESSEFWEEIFEEGHEVAANLMLLVVGVHIAGVVVSSYLHKENLLMAMLTGYNRGAAADGIHKHYLWLAALLLLAVTGFVFVYL